MDIQPARPTHAASHRAIASTRCLIQRSEEYAHLGPQLQKFIDDQLYGCEVLDKFTPSSALIARGRSAGALQATMQLQFNDLLCRNPEPYFATFAYLDGEVPMGHELKNTQTMITVARKALLQHELEGVLTADIDVLLPPGFKQPLVAYHLHGIFICTRSSKRKLRLKKTAEKMNDLIGLDSRLRKGANLRGKLKKGSPSLHAETMATYAGKYTSALKVGSIDVSGNHTYKRDRSLYTAKHAINFLYAWSQIPILESVVPVGKFGEELHANWENILCARAAREARNVSFRTEGLTGQWAEILQTVNSKSR